MTDIAKVTQKAIGSGTMQIAENHMHYEGLSPEQASKLAIDLFMDNFPKLQAVAREVVLERMKELVEEVVRKIEEKYAGDYSAFSDPDMQCALYEAQKGYARRGTKELCDLLSSLLAERSACQEDDYLKIILNRAIEIAPNLQQSHLDYLSLIFVYKHVKWNNIETVEDIRKKYREIEGAFVAPPNTYAARTFTDSFGLTVLTIASGKKVIAQTYGLEEEEIEKVLPSEYANVPSDYALSHVGIALAIFNARTKIQGTFDLKEFIRTY